MARVVWLVTALQDLEGVCAYVAARSGTAGNRLASRMFEAVDRLQAFPRSGRPIPSLDRSDLREVIVDSYRIAYQIHDGEVLILAVRHGARGPAEDEVHDGEVAYSG